MYLHDVDCVIQKNKKNQVLTRPGASQGQGSMRGQEVGAKGLPRLKYNQLHIP